MKINGKNTSIEVPPDTPALWAIRENFGEETIKFGCGKGLCGACTVLVDGIAMRSCVTPIGALKNKDVKTANGFDPNDELAQKLVKNWDENNVAQCGYCQPGQILSAYALLKKNKKLTREQIKTGMNNLCRCGTYGRVIKAIEDTSKEVS